MTDTFTGPIPKVSQAPAESATDTPGACVLHPRQELVGLPQSTFLDRLAFLDEMLDYGERRAYEYGTRYREDKRLTGDQQVFKGFRDIVEDWKARVSIDCDGES